MQGIEAAHPRANGAWAPINGASPAVEVDERPKYTHGPYPYGMPAYQQSPNQSSTAPSLISHSNGDSTSTINSPYPNGQVAPYQHASQPPHNAPYSSVAQHNMAPPSGHPSIASDEQYEKWIGDQEAIRMNTGFDNFAQEAQGDAWVIQDQRAVHNYLEAAWSMPLVGSTGWS